MLFHRGAPSKRLCSVANERTRRQPLSRPIWLFLESKGKTLQICLRPNGRNLFGFAEANAAPSGVNRHNPFVLKAFTASVRQSEASMVSDLWISIQNLGACQPVRAARIIN